MHTVPPKKRTTTLYHAQSKMPPFADIPKKKQETQVKNDQNRLYRRERYRNNIITSTSRRDGISSFGS